MADAILHDSRSAFGAYAVILIELAGRAEVRAPHLGTGLDVFLANAALEVPALLAIAMFGHIFLGARRAVGAAALIELLTFRGLGFRDTAFALGALVVLYSGASGTMSLVVQVGFGAFDAQFARCVLGTALAIRAQTAGFLAALHGFSAGVAGELSAFTTKSMLRKVFGLAIGAVGVIAPLEPKALVHTGIKALPFAGRTRDHDFVGASVA